MRGANLLSGLDVKLLFDLSLRPLSRRDVPTFAGAGGKTATQEGAEGPADQFGDPLPQERWELMKKKTVSRRTLLKSGGVAAAFLSGAGVFPVKPRGPWRSLLPLTAKTT